jgi:hypothetical protein
VRRLLTELALSPPLPPENQRERLARYGRRGQFTIPAKPTEDLSGGRGGSSFKRVIKQVSVLGSRGALAMTQQFANDEKRSTSRCADRRPHTRRG